MRVPMAEDWLADEEKIRSVMVGLIRLCPEPEYPSDGAEDVADALMPLVRKLRSWQGLMGILAEHYPPDVVDGSSGDPGPQIVALTRAVDQLRREREESA